ncbi:MAG: DUF4890 domain-containing protein [Prevotella sp.]|jgi:dihydroorotate dehydrogenase
MMKRIITMIAAVMLIAFTATAQNKEGKQRPRKFDKTEMIKHRTERMVNQYGLNETQAKQLLELNTAYANKMPRMGRRPGKRAMKHTVGQMKDGKGMQCKADCKCMEKMNSFKKERKANRQAYNKKLKSIMTDAQFSKYNEMRKQHMQRQRHGKRHSDANKG